MFIVVPKLLMVDRLCTKDSFIRVIIYMVVFFNDAVVSASILSWVLVLWTLDGLLCTAICTKSHVPGRMCLFVLIPAGGFCPACFIYRV
jgi:hypothetical protein